ncbi:MAG: P1 family peptidase [Phycisphaerales bacterium]|nr:MAG: P1 family peptidase [Phycisphaerales bacterium]
MKAGESCKIAEQGSSTPLTANPFPQQNSQHRREGLSAVRVLPHHKMDPLFTAVVEATEEAVYNSLFKATAMTGRDNHFCQALPVKRVLEICRNYNVLD